MCDRAPALLPSPRPSKVTSANTVTLLRRVEPPSPHPSLRHSITFLHRHRAGPNLSRPRAGSSGGSLSHPELRTIPDASQICVRIKSHLYYIIDVLYKDS